MRVFLAGKVDPKLGAWRDVLLGRAWSREEPKGRPRWVLARPLHFGYDEPAYPAWPQEPNDWVLHQHRYVGPYVVRPDAVTDTKNTGDFHGNTWAGQHGWMDPGDRQPIVEENRKAIRSADLFFAYLNAPDCYGTLLELGYAAAYGVYTYLLVGPQAEWDHDDYWYAGQTADVFTDLGGTPLDDADGYHSFRAVEERQHPTPEQEQRLVRTAFHHALVAWTARPDRHQQGPRDRPGVAPMTEGQRRLLHQLLESYASIAQWTSDPRVRNEAARMLGVLGAPVPYAPGQRG